jgi:hypothetical protein
MSAAAFVNIREAGLLLGGISRWSMARLLRRGLVPYLDLPAGGVRIAVADLEAFKARCRRGAVAEIPACRKPTRAQLRAATGTLAFRTKRIALARLGRTQ